MIFTSNPAWDSQQQAEQADMDAIQLCTVWRGRMALKVFWIVECIWPIALHTVDEVSWNIPENRNFVACSIYVYACICQSVSIPRVYLYQQAVKCGEN